MIEKITGFVAMPHVYLHVFANRLIGKQCAYAPGSRHVRALDERTVGQTVFVLLFPPLVTGSLGLLLLAAWLVTLKSLAVDANPLVYFRTAAAWHQLLWWLGFALVAYAGTALYNIGLAGKLLVKNWGQQPPEDRRKYHHKGKHPEYRS